MPGPPALQIYESHGKIINAVCSLGLLELMPWPAILPYCIRIVGHVRGTFEIRLSGIFLVVSPPSDLRLWKRQPWTLLLVCYLPLRPSRLLLVLLYPQFLFIPFPSSNLACSPPCPLLVLGFLLLSDHISANFLSLAELALFPHQNLISTVTCLDVPSRCERME
ncbi:hypothetical protein P152DRAFT_148277 [Eremomyces bilateralis CBS 781.70]|uniref:Uncharacterized protein n=1 Tax=Eremomyces bilateralis CBS 781.70 TaxID=1392243 RepID=A0A6G1FVC1_9PEZI|nr:uncharacterized protein P152DRAFT_148277 [Eremomyces bilateralis CBS 781.70]KAF1809767.1 hypothetical protein P152DRAFT_148277 [Eremomyces bilateralis CBS 781.70]